MIKTKEIALMGLMLVLTLTISYIERLVPPPVITIPGIKLGLANAVILIFLYSRDAKTTFILNIMRVLLTGVLFSGVWGMVYAMSGAVLSFFVMALFKKSNFWGIIGVSVAGGVAHNLAQIFVAAAIMQNVRLFYYIPILIFSGIAAGILVGHISGLCLNHLLKISYGRQPQ